MDRPIGAAVQVMVALLAVAPLAGCAGAAVYGGVEGASVAVFGRGLLDIGVSAVTGRDCSIVRLDRQQPYCAPRDRLPDAPPYCTRTLGRVECWADPERFTTLPRQVADAPPVTVDQARQITARWPKALNLAD